ncbi:MAG: LysR family transcriptional regulator [Betaproteobacteria bacterium]|nr:LysR family transcriptional regulator [Betaproteobacteria bacterium]
MDRLSAMRVFVQVVDSGSFAGAAQALDLSNAVVTRQVAALEAHLGARLLNRTTRRMSLTEAGDEFCVRARSILEQFAEAEAVAGRGTSSPVGLLRLSAPLSYGISHLAPVLARFRRQHPQLRLDVDLSDRVTDLADEGVDVALRIGSRLDPGIVARRIASLDAVVCAAPSYLQRRGTPREPAELAAHETLSFSYLWAGDEWPFTGPDGHRQHVRVRPSVHSSNGELLRELAVAGGGVILQPRFIVEQALRAGTLVPVLEDYRTLDLNLYAVYLSRSFLPSKVRVFIDFLVDALGTGERA